MCTNGIISLNQPNTFETSDTWPSDESVIAPYWSDIDLREGGDIWYRQTEDKDGDVIKEASKFSEFDLNREYTDWFDQGV